MIRGVGILNSSITWWSLSDVADGAWKLRQPLVWLALLVGGWTFLPASTSVAGCGDHVRSRRVIPDELRVAAGTIGFPRPVGLPIDQRSPGCRGAACGGSLPLPPLELPRVRIINDQPWSLLNTSRVGVTVGSNWLALGGERFRPRAGFPASIERPPAVILLGIECGQPVDFPVRLASGRGAD